MWAGLACRAAARAPRLTGRRARSQAPPRASRERRHAAPRARPRPRRADRERLATGNGHQSGRALNVRERAAGNVRERGLNAQIRAGASMMASGVQTICIRQAWWRRAGARTSTHPRRPRSPPRRNPCSRVFARALGLLRESVPATRVAPPATFSPLSRARALQMLRACARACAPAQVGECPRLSVNGRRPARAHARARPSPAAAGRRSTAYPPARKRAHSCARSCSSESSPSGASSTGFTTDLSPVISSLSPPLSASMSSSARIARSCGRGGGRGSGKRQRRANWHALGAARGSGCRRARAPRQPFAARPFANPR